MARPVAPVKARRCRTRSTWFVSGASIRPGRGSSVAGAGRFDQRGRQPAQHAQSADAVLVVTPYHNKPTREGLYQHFKAINDAIGIPILITTSAAFGDRYIGRYRAKRLLSEDIAGVKTQPQRGAAIQRAAMGEISTDVGEDHRAPLGPRRPRLHR